MGSGPSSSAKKLEGQNIVLNAKKEKMVVNTPKPGEPVQEITPLEGKLIRSANGVHFVELESSDPANPEIIAVAASVYNDPQPASHTSPESPTDENMPPMEEPEQPPANGNVAVTMEKPPEPMKGGKRKSSKSHRNHKKRNSRKRKIAIM
jgi:hypothetical protein